MSYMHIEYLHDYWYLLNKYISKSENFDVFFSSWMKKK